MNPAADLRYALRMLKSNPAFTAIAVAALALGIGANTAIFTVVNAVVLKPLPYPHPERLVQLGRKYPNGFGESNSIPKYMTWRHNDVFEAMTLYSDSGLGVNLGTGDRPNEVKEGTVSKDYFQVFGVTPLLGRPFNEAEDLPGGPAAAVLTYRIWQSRLGGDPSIVGRIILLDKRPYTVVGVMPKGFESGSQPIDVWTDLQADPQSTNQGHYLRVAARLKPGVTIEQARAEMTAVGEQFRRANPQWMDKAESVGVRPMGEAVAGDAKLELLVLEGAVGFVLLIACANVANLLLARSAVRQREFAVRAAVGASRGRVLSQLLTESVLLAGIGGIAGLVLGTWGVRALLALVPGDIPRLTQVNGVVQAPPLDATIALFTAGVAVLTGVLFGLFPALHISNTDLASVLKEGGRGGGAGRRQGFIRSSLVVMEMALSLVLLIGAALLIRTFIGLHSVDPGIDPRHVLTLQTSTSSGAYATTARMDAFTTAVERRLSTMPGVVAAGSSLLLPMEDDVDLPFTIVGHAPAKGRWEGDEQWRSVSGDYFKAFRIPLLRGRYFDDRDKGNSPPAVIIDEKLARKYWPHSDPLGQSVIIGQYLGPQFADPPRQIVGVVGGVCEVGLGDGKVPVMYIPQSQVPQGITDLANSIIPLSWEIRTAGDPLAMSAAVESELRDVDGLLPISHVRSMEQVMSASLGRQNFNMTLLSVFAAIALLLASIGIYGLMAYAVEQRTQEIGVRMALGANRRDMLRLIVMQGVKLAGIGVVLGLAAAFGLTRFLGHLLFGVNSADPLTFGGVALALTAAAALAAYFPARHAAAVSPMDALRQ
jgi:putative ABC transport system permease protein